MRRLRWGTLLALSGMVLLVGCSAVEAAERPAAVQESESPSPTPIDPDAPAPTPSVEADAPTKAPAAEVETGPIDEPIELSTGLVIELDSVSATTVTAATPGEVSGPAVVVKLTARNDSRETADLDSAVVTLTAADGEYGIGTTAGPNTPLAGDLEPGDSASGSYVFMLDPAADRSVTVSVNYSAGEPVAEFSGKTD
ncbi:hypothetical protein Q9S71_03880 [Microbacterium sp. KSW4-11]|uniref:DUF4352 domain-containing protein n=1 Tax=Microbacterium gawkjiense TaxID=3067309 RepID=A0ABU3G812_9MICO|nr:hypothetical protein [Microbacterium sp. KSW4-11]MDT3315954.1 hypothetical protein [Microbacterium sp. KSW4-11]